MKHTADYIIQLPEGKIVSLLFNSWTFKTYCEKNKIEFDGLILHVISNREKLPDLFFVAAESFHKFNNEKFPYNEIESYVWMDELGGFNSDKIIDIWKVVARKLFAASPDKVDEMFNKLLNGEVEESEEKKSLAAA